MERMASYHNDAEKVIKAVNKAYNLAASDLDYELSKIFNRFSKDGKLTPAEARKLLNEPISRAEWNDIKSKLSKIKDPDIKRQMLNRLNAPAYSARITRIQALKENAYIQSKIIADAEIRLSKAGYIDVINNSYYQSMFDIQKGLGIGFEFAAIPTQIIKTIVANPWSGKHFSKRVWGNTGTLADLLNDTIAAGFMSGSSYRKMTQELMGVMEVGKFAASRLIRTECTYAANAGEMEAYQEAEIDKYIFVATLDNRTSKQCQDHDRKVYKVKDSMPGKNMPPLHAFCRSSTRAYFGPSTLAGIQRRARDPETGKTTLVPASMSYKEWDKKHRVTEKVPLPVRQIEFADFEIID
ncbi:SPP1 gp7 family putative phage head morphogenesis protein [Paenibacillus anaericanus]|uniref:minor capsid protein n=1 Tax=Paenibacillus anaericanus TaxID=170367 RepID=UPI0027893B2C|nr:minor capsid protein [Paenibacillus anaericanus]MDQ0091660.1 SPP1 gp7 family putative phage head morphogenesis protein [Paenibacillus anaericanus]